MSKKPWLLQSSAERALKQEASDPSLLACSLQAAMNRNKELREELDKLSQELEKKLVLLRELKSNE